MNIKRVLSVILTIGTLLLTTGGLAQAGGGPIGQRFPISPLNASELAEVNSAVAYNSWWQEYLVVWARDFANGERHIYGQFVDHDGTLIGSPFLISGFIGSCGQPDVVYNSSRNEYLVVYQFSSPSGYGIYGLRLNASGQAVSTQITFAASATDQYWDPAVAYATVSSAYLVVWDRHQPTGSTGIQFTLSGVEARSLTGDGTTMSNILAVTGMLAYVDPAMPDVAYTRAGDEFLVVWQQWFDSNHTDRDIMGQRIGLTGGIHLIGSGISIYYATDDETEPAAAWVPRPSGGGEYLVTCSRALSPSSTCYIYGQLMTDAGARHGPSFLISPDSGSMPAVAGNENTHEFLVAWKHGGVIQARTVTTVGVPGPYAASQPDGLDPHYPAVAAGPLGDYLVTYNDLYSGYPPDVFGFLWGNRVFLPLVQRH